MGARSVGAPPAVVPPVAPCAAAAYDQRTAAPDSRPDVSAQDIATAERGDSPRVLQVLPHPGGGGETYVNALERMNGYPFDRRYLVRRPTLAALGPLPARAPGINLELRRSAVGHVHGEVAALACLPGLAAGPSFVTLHGLNLLRRLGGVRGLWATLNLRLIVRAASRTICVSHAERDQVVEAVGPEAAGRVVTIQNGVDVPPLPTPSERAAARAELGLPAAASVVVSVGALWEPKDPVTTARAAIAASGSVPLVLLFVGDGPLRGQVEQVSRGAEPVVRLLGTRSDVGRALAASDFFVLSSQREGLPFAVLEAMATGLAPIVSDVPGCVEAVGETGMIVSRGDSDALADAFRRLATSAVEREALGAQARERAARHFPVARMVEETRQLYDEVLAE
jgi:glycosyltransferase involved in cell wall biosynthesis